MSQWVGAHPYGDRLQSDSSTLSIEPSTVIMADASFVCGMVSRCDSVQEPPGSGLLDCLTTAHRLDSRYPCDRREEAIGGESLVMEWNPADVNLRVL